MSGLLAVKIDITLVNPNHPKVWKKNYFYQKKEKMSNPIVEQFPPHLWNIKSPIVEHLSKSNTPTVEELFHNRSPKFGQSPIAEQYKFP